jgi:hypothetical protein
MHQVRNTLTGLVAHTGTEDECWEFIMARELGPGLDSDHLEVEPAYDLLDEVAEAVAA